DAYIWISWIVSRGYMLACRCTSQQCLLKGTLRWRGCIYLDKLDSFKRVYACLLLGRSSKGLSLNVM
ncbi:MAG: hypothetical protein WCH52_09740, partial [Bacteroidota bacterium]